MRNLKTLLSRMKAVLAKGRATIEAHREVGFSDWYSYRDEELCHIAEAWKLIGKAKDGVPPRHWEDVEPLLQDAMVVLMEEIECREEELFEGSWT